MELHNTNLDTVSCRAKGSIKLPTRTIVEKAAILPTNQTRLAPAPQSASCHTQVGPERTRVRSRTVKRERADEARGKGHSELRWRAGGDRIAGVQSPKVLVLSCGRSPDSQPASQP